MPIGDIHSKISDADREKIKDKRHPPDYQEGFEPGAGEGDWGDLEDMFGGGGGDSLPGLDGGGTGQDPFGGGGTGQDPFGGGGTGQDPFASPPPMRPQTGNPFGNPMGGQATGQFGQTMYGQPMMGQTMVGQQQQPVQPKPDAVDKIFEAAGDGGGALISVLGEMVKTFGTRNYDDWGRYCRNLIIAALVCCGIGVGCMAAGFATSLKVFSFINLPATMILSGMLTAVIGGLGLMACGILIATSADKYNLESGLVGDLEPEVEGFSNEQIEGSLGDSFGAFGNLDDTDDDGFGDIFGDAADENDETADEPEEHRESFFDQFAAKASEPEMDFSGKFSETIRTIGKKPILNREVLFGTFKGLFPTNTLDFDKRVEIDKESDEFTDYETICMKALAAAIGKADISEVPSWLDSAVETLYTLEFRIKRVAGMTKLDAISREMVAYLRSSVNDEGISCTTDIDGDFYVATVTKGTTAVVTFGDLFRRKDVCDFYLNTKNLLPICVGVKMDGQPVLVDAKLFDTMLIAGRPRSGKSWYVLSIIMSLCAFNTPEQVQFLVVDPKKSNMMNTLHLLPHVCGVVDDSNILAVLDGVIEGEGARRKKLLSEHHCDKWSDLWEIGVQVPVLYIVIDEFMTVRENLNDGSLQEFMSKVKVIISQLPSLGIRLIIVPHRSKGVVDVTARTNISFSAAVRAEPSVILETLDIKKWDIPLLNPGDTAVKMQGMGEPFMVSGVAVTSSDMENAKFIENIARLYYQMGVDIPDMSSIGPGYTRNDDAILEELKAGRDSKRVQQDIDALPGGEDW